MYIKGLKKNYLMYIIKYEKPKGDLTESIHESDLFPCFVITRIRAAAVLHSLNSQIPPTSQLLPPASSLLEPSPCPARHSHRMVQPAAAA